MMLFQKSLFYVWPLVLLFISLSGCRQQKQVDVQRLSEIDLSNQNDITLLDVRTLKEVNEGYIKGARHLDFFDSSFKSRLSEFDKSKTYYVYCKSGGRSSKTVELMQEMGFANVYNVVGGFSAWVKSNYPISNVPMN